MPCRITCRLSRRPNRGARGGSTSRAARPVRVRSGRGDVSNGERRSSIGPKGRGNHTAKRPAMRRLPRCRIASASDYQSLRPACRTRLRSVAAMPEKTSEGFWRPAMHSVQSRHGGHDSAFRGRRTFRCPPVPGGVTPAAAPTVAGAASGFGPRGSCSCLHAACSGDFRALSAASPPAWAHQSMPARRPPRSRRLKQSCPRVLRAIYRLPAIADFQRPATRRETEDQLILELTTRCYRTSSLSIPHAHPLASLQDRREFKTISISQAA